MPVTSVPMSTAGSQQAEDCVSFLMQMNEGVKKKSTTTTKNKQANIKQQQQKKKTLRSTGRWQIGVPTHH